MGIFDQAKKLVSEHEEKLDDAVDKVAGFVDDKTGGKHADKIGKGAGAAKDLIDRLAGSDDDGATGATGGEGNEGDTGTEAPEASGAQGADDGDRKSAPGPAPEGGPS